MGRAGDILAAVILVAATFAVNAHTLDFDFVYDDHAVVLERTPAWQQDAWTFLGTRAWGIGRHLTLLSLDADRLGNDPPLPRPFHRTNIVLAALVSLLVFRLGRALELSSFAAGTGALLFTLHPAHVDAVVSIVGRAELLAALCVLAAVLLHVRGYPPRGWGLALAAALLAAGMESKESAACLPLLLAVYDLSTGSRARPTSRTIAGYAVYVVVLAAWLVFAGSRLQAGADIDFVDNPLAFLPAWERILHAGAILWRYAGLLVWPLDLQTDHSYPDLASTRWLGTLALLAWLAAAAGLWRQRHERPRAVFLLAWFPAAFAVTSNLAVPIGTVMADRLVFLPSVGPCLLAGALIGALSTHRPSLATLAAAAAGFALALGYHSHSLVWTCELHFHRQTAQDASHSAKAHYNLGLALARAGRLEQAEASFRRALRLYPGFRLAVAYLSRTLLEQGKQAEAADAYRTYLDAVPEDTDALAAYAELSLQLGRTAEARRAAQRLVELEPGDSDHLLLLSRCEAAAAAVSP